jgi:hypothetical protein
MTVATIERTRAQGGSVPPDERDEEGTAGGKAHPEREGEQGRREESAEEPEAPADDG